MRYAIGKSLEPTSLFESAKELIHIIEPRQEQGGVEVIGLPTGFADLNYLTGGYRKGDMYVVAAKTGNGKTAFALGESIKVAEDGGVVMYLSLEMSAHMMALRVLASMTGVNSMAIERGNMSDETFRMVKDAAEKLSGLPLYFFDQVVDTPTLNDVYSKMKNKLGLDMSVVDYIALLDDLPTESGYARLTFIANEIKKFTVKQDIPIIAVSQLNRASLNREGGRPQVQDLKESGQIENNAALVLFPFLIPKQPDEEGYNPKVIPGELLIAKNRHGPNDQKIEVDFIPSQLKWVERIVDAVDPPSARR